MRFRSALLCLMGLLLASCSSAGVSSDAQTSPEKVVAAFYSVVNTDQSAALQLVAADARTDVQTKLDKMKDWTFQNVVVKSVDGDEVTVSMDIVIDGETDSGTDQVTVTEDNGTWWIMDIPS